MKNFGFIILFVIFIFGCTEKKQEETHNLPALAPTTTIAQGPSPEEIEATNKCNELWAPAAEAYKAFSEKSTIDNFKKLSSVIPKPEEKLTRCEKQDVIMNALDSEMDKLSKNSGGVFEFTVFLARVWHIGDGAVAEGMCEQGAMLLKKDATAFVKALKQESKSTIHTQCLVASTYEFVDRPEAEIRKGLQTRIELLKKVKDKDLQELRDNLIEAINARMRSYP